MLEQFKAGKNSLAHLNSLVDTANLAANLSNVNKSALERLPGAESFFAKIKTEPETGKYTFIECFLDSAEVWQEKPAGRGKGAEKSLELNSMPGLATDSIVRMFAIGDGKYYVFLSGMAGKVDDPVELLPAGLEGEESSQTDTWSITDQPESQFGFKIKIQTRTVYKESGDKVLYGFYRELTIDSAGKIVSASVEARYTVDTPEACE